MASLAFNSLFKGYTFSGAVSSAVLLRISAIRRAVFQLRVVILLPNFFSNPFIKSLVPRLGETSTAAG
jgi:hypothetical protein